MATDKPKTKRRWLQFSLRTMMVVVTVFCVWLGITAKRARDQKQAVEMIPGLPGLVYYEYQLVDERYTLQPPDAPGLKPPGPKWLRQLLGDDYFFSVYYINPIGSKVNDDILATIAKTLTDVK